MLDLVLPDGEGVEVCRRCGAGRRLPILVLSAVGDEREKVRALDAGADDYVTKPFGTDELLARLRAVLRRSVGETAGSAAIELGELVIDLADRRVTRAGDEVHLTPIEFELVRVLSQHQGRLVTHRQLLQEVWGPGVRRGDPLPARPRRPHPRQARGRPLAAAVPDHRARRRLSPATTPARELTHSLRPLRVLSGS